MSEGLFGENQPERKPAIGGEIHGKIICSKCGKLIMTCKCMGCSDNIQYDVCSSCKGNEPNQEPQLEPHWEMLRTIRKKRGN